jgi:hypothetical protein
MQLSAGNSCLVGYISVQPTSPVQALGAEVSRIFLLDRGWPSGQHFIVTFDATAHQHCTLQGLTLGHGLQMHQGSEQLSENRYLAYFLSLAMMPNSSLWIGFVSCASHIHWFHDVAMCESTVISNAWDA